ncbi:MAG: hypothetical protein SF069_09150 [Phycisphaerae bacterium]|nr:hypothetical protein [Phycisphaerae bacterium]
MKRLMWRKGTGTMLFLAATTMATRAQAGECGGWDSPFGTPAGVTDTAAAAASWDPDGDGPQPTLLYVGGEFSAAGGTPAQGIAAWDGEKWGAVGGAVSFDSGPAQVFALRAWAAEGPGPSGGLLIAGGDFIEVGNVPALGMAGMGRCCVVRPRRRSAKLP